MIGLFKTELIRRRGPWRGLDDGRDRHLGMGRLVQQPTPASRRSATSHPRSRSQLLPHTTSRLRTFRWQNPASTEPGAVQVGDEVTAQQMQALFGAGLHPLAQQRRERLEGPGPERAGLQGGDPAGGAVQGVHRRCDRVPGRGRQADRGPRRLPGAPARLPGPGAGAGADPHPGRHRDVPRRARPGPRATPASCPGRSRNCPGRGPRRSAGST